jgi:hypothetical protein
LQVEKLEATKLKWQVLVIQAGKNTSVLNGRLEITFTGTEGARAWTASLPNGALPVKVGQYGRMEGVLDVPLQVVVKGASVRLMEGANVRATHAIKF